MTTPARAATHAGRTSLIVVAAGRGTRLGAGVPKAFVPLGGRTILERTLDRARGAGFADVVVVAPADLLDRAQDLGAAALAGHGGDPPGPGPTLHVVAGGAQRTDSVAAGLAALPGSDAHDRDVVLVHDAARCLTPTSLFEAVVAAVRGGEVAVIPGLPVSDTIKSVDEHGRVTATPERGRLRAIQTPQGFRRDVLEAAHDLVRAGRAGAVTDDAALVELLGRRVLVIDGDPAAHKVTTPADLDLVGRLL